MYGTSYVVHHMYVVPYIYLYDLFKLIPYISMIYLSGALPQVWARDQLAWVPVRGQEHISSCTWHINELNCKIIDREERLR